jgi:hypothetical protein
MSALLVSTSDAERERFFILENQFDSIDFMIDLPMTARL